MVNFSSHHEFEYKMAYPAAIVGEVLTHPSHLSLKLLSHVVSPLRPGSKVKAIATKIAAVALVVLSLPYNLTFGLVGLLLTTVTVPFRKDVVVSSSKANLPVRPLRTLKVCTFNTALLPDIINSLKPHEPMSHISPMEGTTEERVAKIVHEILQREDDVVCFQEVFEPKAARLLAQKLTIHFPYAVLNVGATGLFLNSGLMIVSKYPLDKPKFIPFTEARGADSWAKKGVLGVTVLLAKGLKVNILNTHLNSDAGLFGWKEGVQSTRLKQLDQVKQLAKTYNGLLEQAIICGDFNSTNIPEIENDYHIVQKNQGWDVGIDYILVPKKGMYNRVLHSEIDPMNDVSDHPAVRAQLAL